eukprot:1159721-Pelagomonas_calceolata.AAC.4
MKEKRVPRAEAPCIYSTKRKKRSTGIRRSSISCLILVTIIERSLLKSVSGASKFKGNWTILFRSEML